MHASSAYGALLAAGAGLTTLAAALAGRVATDALATGAEATATAGADGFCAAEAVPLSATLGTLEADGCAVLAESAASDGTTCKGGAGSTAGSSCGCI